jgi:hypothetical protein
MLAQVTHFLPLTTIRRERTLPSAGKVLVRKGQRLSATDVVAEANLNFEHRLLDIGRGLGLNEEEADKYVQVKAGVTVAEGDVLAGPVGLARRVVRSPHSGRVMLVGSGQVLLEVQGQPFSLKAGIPGDVVDLIPDRGAVIEIAGALVQGVWGNGLIDFGLMYALAKSPEQVLTHDRLDVSLRGSIAIAGHCADGDVLKTAGELPLRGLILASIEANLIPVASRANFPIVVIEGFGRRPMNSVAFTLLTTNERREVTLNAEPWDPYAGTRPEIIIPLPASGTPANPKDVIMFTAGQTVRIVSGPSLGKTGLLSALPGSITFPTGLRSQAGEVQFEDGQSVLLPLSNLEVLE